MTATTRARLSILGAAALFSTGGATIKATTLSGLQVAGLRSAIAALALFAFLPHGRRLRDARAAAVGACYAAVLVLFVLANKLTTSANAIFLQDTAPLYILVLGPLLLGERARGVDLVCMALIGAGMALFFAASPAAQATAPDPARGNALAAVCGVMWALTLIGLRRLGRDASPERDAGAAAVVLGNLFAAAACLPWMFPLSFAGPGEAAVMLYLGVFQIGLAYVLITRATPHVGALELSLLLLLEPALNPAWSWFVHAENPGALPLLGGALILSATAARAAAKEPA